MFEVLHGREHFPQKGFAAQHHLVVERDVALEEVEGAEHMVGKANLFAQAEGSLCQNMPEMDAEGREMSHLVLVVRPNGEGPGLRVLQHDVLEYVFVHGLLVDGTGPLVFLQGFGTRSTTATSLTLVEFFTDVSVQEIAHNGGRRIYTLRCRRPYPRSLPFVFLRHRRRPRKKVRAEGHAGERVFLRHLVETPPRTLATNRPMPIHEPVRTCHVTVMRHPSTPHVTWPQNPFIGEEGDIPPTHPPRCTPHTGAPPPRGVRQPSVQPPQETIPGESIGKAHTCRCSSVNSPTRTSPSSSSKRRAWMNE